METLTIAEALKRKAQLRGISTENVYNIAEAVSVIAQNEESANNGSSSEPVVVIISDEGDGNASGNGKINLTNGKLAASASNNYYYFPYRLTNPNSSDILQEGYSVTVSFLDGYKGHVWKSTNGNLGDSAVSVTSDDDYTDSTVVQYDSAMPWLIYCVRKDDVSQTITSYEASYHVSTTVASVS